MFLNDVVHIKVPEGQVKYIQDSNGEIIWVSHNLFDPAQVQLNQRLNSSQTTTAKNGSIVVDVPITMKDEPTYLTSNYPTEYNTASLEDGTRVGYMYWLDSNKTILASAQLGPLFQVYFGIAKNPDGTYTWRIDRNGNGSNIGINYANVKYIRMELAINIGVVPTEDDLNDIVIVQGDRIAKNLPLFTNQVSTSIDTDGNVYNGIGYKTGYRVRSGGAEETSSSTVCTGFIPLKRGDTLRIYPPFNGGNVDNAINFSDATFTNLGQTTDYGARYGICQNSREPYMTTLVDGVSTLTLSDATDANIRYVRITHRLDYANDMIIAINESIKEA